LHFTAVPQGQIQVALLALVLGASATYRFQTTKLHRNIFLKDLNFSSGHFMLHFCSLHRLGIFDTEQAILKLRMGS
jgi:uncharacterized membrane protein